MNLKQAEKFFNVKADESDKSVAIHIYGTIGWNESAWGEGTNNVAIALVSLIKRLEKSYDRINIHINSPGGFVDDGLAIFNTIKNSSAEIHTYNDGLAASMAGIILLAGHQIHMPKSSIFHIHSVWGVVIGNKNDILDFAATLETFDKAIAEAIAARLEIEEKDVLKKWFDGKDHYMTGKEASDLGFADFLEDEVVNEPPENVENFTYKELYNYYKNISEKEAKKKPGLFQKLFGFDNQENNKKNHTTMKKFLALMTLLALDAIMVNEDNKVVLDLAQAEKINDELDLLNADLAKANEDLESLKEKSEELEKAKEELNAANEKIKEIEEKLDNTPAGSSTQQKVESDKGDGVDWETIDQLPHNQEVD